MKTIKKDEYIFLVDTQKTKDYYKTHYLCDCACCRNYYAQVREKLPKLDAFLKEFGVDISKPDEIISAENNGYMDCISVDYTVCGKVDVMGEYEIDIYDDLFLSIVVTNGFVSSNEQTKDYFTLTVYQIQLPWILDESFPKQQNKNGKEKSKKKFIQNYTNEDCKRLKVCYNNIKNKVSNKCLIDNFIEQDDRIAFSGTLEEPELLLTLSIVTSQGKHYLYADIDDEMSWQEWDFNNQDEFENSVVEFIVLLVNRTIKTIVKKKKHKYIKTSRFYLSENDEWILIDEDVEDNIVLKLFLFKDSIKEDVKEYKLR